MRNFQQFFGVEPIEYRTRLRVIIEQLAECLTASDIASSASFPLNETNRASGT